MPGDLQLGRECAPAPPHLAEALQGELTQARHGRSEAFIEQHTIGTGGQPPSLRLGFRLNNHPASCSSTAAIAASTPPDQARWFSLSISLGGLAGVGKAHAAFRSSAASSSSR